MKRISPLKRAQAGLELLVLFAALTAALVIWLQPAQAAYSASIEAIKAKEAEAIASNICALAREANSLGKGNMLQGNLKASWEVLLGYENGELLVSTGGRKHLQKCVEIVFSNGKLRHGTVKLGKGEIEITAKGGGKGATVIEISAS